MCLIVKKILPQSCVKVQELHWDSCKVSIPIQQQGKHRVPWLTSELNCMRQHVKAARRRFQKCENVVIKKFYRDKYQELKNKYSLKLLDVQINSWKNFLDEINVNNVWKKVYIFGIKQNFQKRVEVSGITLPCRTVMNSSEETIDEVLCNSFPEDCENNDKDCHKQIRYDSLFNSTTANDPPLLFMKLMLVLAN
ncbi:hypothetical protein AVEN_144339-1 [Araneus ventricosus]|uniref:Uncharacterized protein n=1 Tax=Araneus ventricosus TaxID=182803 RepID=A0A4Y2K727_ARAVE|nr:hypothetical protein AVEN_144339-1 [Araneus ventricosus]